MSSLKRTNATASELGHLKASDKWEPTTSTKSVDTSVATTSDTMSSSITTAATIATTTTTTSTTTITSTKSQTQPQQQQQQQQPQQLRDTPKTADAPQQDEKVNIFI